MSIIPLLGNFDDLKRISPEDVKVGNIYLLDSYKLRSISGQLTNFVMSLW